MNDRPTPSTPAGLAQALAQSAGRERRAARRRRLLRAAGTLAVLLVLACGYLVELWGGRGPVPSWATLYGLVGEQWPLPAQAVPQAGATTVLVLDVGQGDAVLICRQGEACLIDAGPAEAEAAVLAALHGAGVEQLDLLVMTHPHADHIGGMQAVVEVFSPRTLLLPDLAALGASGPVLDGILQAADRVGAEQVTARADQEFPLGDGVLTVLQAGVEAAAAEQDDAVNDASLCIRFEADGFVFLDTGDAEQAAEQALVDRYGGALKATLLKAGHHGSDTSNTEAFLSAVSPQAVAISCGQGNDYGHPHAAVLRRLQAVGAEIRRTDQEGTLVFLWQDGALAEPAA